MSDLAGADQPKDLGTPTDERALLVRLVEVDRDRVALLARFGSEEAARVLGTPIVEPPRVLSLSMLAEINQAFVSWEAGVVYVRGALQHVLAWWAKRGTDYREVVDELAPTLAAVNAWFEGERTEEAAEAALAWARAGGARASLVQGRFQQEGRALGHLALALSGLAYVCAPLHEPLRRGDPVGLIIARFGIRMKRIGDIRREVGEAVKGVLYMQRPELSMSDPDYAATVDAALRPFEVLAAGELRRWALATAPPC